MVSQRQKYKMHRLISLSLVFFKAFTLNCLAGSQEGGNTSGGGGGGIVCYFPDQSAYFDPQTRNHPYLHPVIELEPAKKQIASITAIDLIVARNFYSLENLDLMHTGESELEYLERMVRDLNRLSPRLGRALARKLDAIFFRLASPDESWDQILDYNRTYATISREAGISGYNDNRLTCKPQTLAVQVTDRGGLTLVRLSYDLCRHEKYLPESRGVTYLHELVYSWARELGQSTSVPTSIAVAAWLNQKNLSRREIEATFRAQGFLF